jgi:hypothetical protein
MNADERRLDAANAVVESCGPKMRALAPKRVIVVPDLLGCCDGQDIAARNQDCLAG